LADEIVVHFDREKNEALRGVSRRQSLLILLNGHPASEEDLLEWMDRKNRYYQEFLEDITPADLLPGVENLLTELRQANIKAALASASKNATEVVDRLQIRGMLDSISDGYSVEKPKPEPDLFLHAAASVGIQPANCVVVEDAEAGVEAGIRAGMRTIGIGPVQRVGAANLVLENGFEGVHLTALLKALA